MPCSFACVAFFAKAFRALAKAAVLPALGPLGSTEVLEWRGAVPSGVENSASEAQADAEGVRGGLLRG
eukprot:15311798-Alexandrium_andersonii.AAC.1